MKLPKPYISIAIVVVNLIIFFIELFAGGSEDTAVALKAGALYVPLVLEEGQWYRLITCMFVHFGTQHLLGNTLSIFAIGPYVEAYFGHVRTLILYLLSGLGGSLLTMAVEMWTGEYAISAGASGAIFGFLGVLALFSMLPFWKRFFPVRRVLAALVLALLPGLTVRNISMTAHIGGLITGFVLGWIMHEFKRKRLHKLFMAAYK